jgi:hypothetical protein
MQRTIKRVSPVSRILFPRKGTAIICLVPILLSGSSGLPGNLRSEQLRTGKPETISLFDLASGVVYLAPVVTNRTVGSYPAISPLTILKAWLYIFCGTISNRKISLMIPGSYPAPCSMKFGLSSFHFKRKATARTD